jgi:hypothetical protein
MQNALVKLGYAISDNTGYFGILCFQRNRVKTKEVSVVKRVLGIIVE